MNVVDAARYLHLSADELTRLASDGDVRARKVSGEWRFYRPDLNEWLERQMSTLTGQELVRVDRHISAREHRDTYEPLVSDLLSPYSVNLTCPSRTKPSVLRGLVSLAQASGLLLDPVAVSEAVIERENMYSTALGPGVAFPHPREPMPKALTDSVVAFARTPAGIPFGAPDGTLTDLFFLVCAADDQAHLRTLARLARLVRENDLMESLRTVSDVTECVHLLRRRELGVFGPEARD
jgi:PTS system nitrogen regulatory IIA component